MTRGQHHHMGPKAEKEEVLSPIREEEMGYPQGK